MQYIQSMGGVWKLSKKQYEQLVKDLKEEKEIDLDNYGKQVTTNLLNLEELR